MSILPTENRGSSGLPENFNFIKIYKNNYG